MATVYTNDQKLAGQTSIIYDSTTVSYDSNLYNYNGQLTTLWTDDPEQT